MRTQLILGRPHGKTELVIIANADVSLAKQSEAIRELTQRANGPDKKFAEVQVWTSDGGIQRTIRFMKPDDFEASEKRRKADAEKHKKHLESLAKKDAKPEAKTEPKPEAKPEETTPPAA